MAVTHNEYAKRKTYSEHQEAIFILGMVGIKKANGVLVEEYGLCFFEGDLVLELVGPPLFVVPLELDLIHMYIVHITFVLASCFPTP